MFEDSFKGVSRQFHEIFNVFSGKIEGHSRELQGYLKEVQRGFRGSFKTVSKTFQGSFKGV